MGPDSFTVDPDELDAVVADIARTERALETLTNDVERQIAKLARRRRTRRTLFEHFKKHQDEFPGVRNAKEYVEAAKRFLTDPPAGTYARVRESDGAIVRYDPATNTFGVMSKDGVMNTMFKPDPAKLAPRFKDAWDYFLHHRP